MKIINWPGDVMKDVGIELKHILKTYRTKIVDGLQNKNKKKKRTDLKLVNMKYWEDL